MRVLEWSGGVHVDHLTERRHVGDATPLSRVAAKGPVARTLKEDHRAVMGLPNLGVESAVPERIPEAEPSPRRPAEAVEEPLFRREEESGARKAARVPSHRARGKEQRSPGSAGLDDARGGSRTKPGGTDEPRESKSGSRGEGGARSGPPPGGQQRPTEFDLSLWCEGQFVSGLSSQQAARVEDRDDQE
jgi:hypothetical protein